MTYRKDRSETERQEARERARERLQGAMRQLEEGIGRILDSESFAEYLRAMSRFHTYSAHNVALIWTNFPRQASHSNSARWSSWASGAS